MTKNMGLADRLIRTLLAVVVIVLYLTNQITGTAAVILGIIAIIFLLTSAVGLCPLYLPLKLSTTGTVEAAPPEATEAVPIEPEPPAAAPPSEPAPEPAPETAAETAPPDTPEEGPEEGFHP